jgi:hypothetical protein
MAVRMMHRYEGRQSLAVDACEPGFAFSFVNQFNLLNVLVQIPNKMGLQKQL